MRSAKTNPKRSPKSPTPQNASGLFIVGNNQRAVTSRFGLAIRKRRKELNISQTELAERAGLNRSYLSDLERGLTGISLERAQRLATVLNCSLQDLL